MEAKRFKELSSENPIAAHLLRAEVVAVSPMDERVGVIHATSIEMINQMLHSGRLLDRSASRGPRGDTEFLGIATPPLVKNNSTIDLKSEAIDLLTQPNELRDATSPVYAEGLAQAHYLLTGLGLPLDDSELINKAEEFLFESHPKTKLIDAIMGIGGYELNTELDFLTHVGPEFLLSLSRLTEEARKRKGFLVGISPSRTDLVVVRGVDNRDPQTRFSFGTAGIPYAAISAIEPLGSEEKKLLETLRKK